ncbi:MAG: hypothetical protein OHK006_12670 [Thermodesulfovibrionales bacterium]
MAWSFSFQLLPGESVLEDSTVRETALVKAAYSVFLTEQRAIFRFDGLGSSLCKAFFYQEIIEAEPTTRLFVGYLRIRTRSQEAFFNIHDAGYWAGRILERRAVHASLQPESRPDRKRGPENKRLLLDMLVALKKNGLLTDEEFERKVSQLDSLPG